MMVVYISVQHEDIWKNVSKQTDMHCIVGICGLYGNWLFPKYLCVLAEDI